MNKDIEEKLNWIINNCPDVRRSQLHTTVVWSPLHNSILYTLFDFDRYQTIYYEDLASWLIDMEDEQWKKYGKEIEKTINTLYEDAKNNNMWGVVYDW